MLRLRFRRANLLLGKGFTNKKSYRNAQGGTGGNSNGQK